MKPESALVVAGLSAGYDGVSVLREAALEVAPGEAVALIGSNGAGKSTLLGALSGIVDVFGGSARFRGRELVGLRPDEIVRTGVVHVPQGRRLFARLSVRENLLMGAYLRNDSAAVGEDMERVLALLPRLRERLAYPAGRLSGGEQQQVAIARALMARPRLLMIDEMSLGLAPLVVEQLLEILAQVRKDDVALLLVEQDVQTALEFADRAYVLESGAMRANGEARSLLENPDVKRAYLGM